MNTARTAGPATATPADPATNRLQGIAYDERGNVLAHEGGTDPATFVPFEHVPGNSANPNGTSVCWK